MKAGGGRELEDVKERLRKEILRKRIEYSDRFDANKKIVERIRELEEFKKAKTVLLYYPIKGEPDITPLFYEIKERKGRVAFPKIKGDEIEAVEVNDLEDLRKGKFNIPEPAGGGKISPEELDIVFVPGIVFDMELYRIGFGKGFYDRFLKNVKCPKVGVAYSFQIVNSFPHSPWDVPLDIIVTEKGVIRR